MSWVRHVLQARGTMQPWMPRIGAALDGVETAFRAACGAALPDIDILIERAPGGVIPELGLGGSCMSPRKVSLTFDPANPCFAASLERGEVERTFAHELHHAARHETVGYGWTLGEALVSEGFADHFAAALTGCDEAPPWCRVFDETSRAAVTAAAAPLLAKKGYDHAVWFFGRGALPRWAGYSLGYEVAGRFLARTGTSPLHTADIPADAVLTSAWT